MGYRVVVYCSDCVPAAAVYEGDNPGRYDQFCLGGLEAFLVRTNGCWGLVEASDDAPWAEFDDVDAAGDAAREHSRDDDWPGPWEYRIEPVPVARSNRS